MTWIEPTITVIGGGLSGVEAANMIARLGHKVVLYEMRPTVLTPAHKTDQLAELVCSNSLGSDQSDSASGVLKEEMQFLGSLVLEAAYQTPIPAGKALGVDREKFANHITRHIEAQPKIVIERKESTQLPQGLSIVATGPLTSEAFSQALLAKLNSDTLYFYDSISPIVDASTIDYDKTFFGSRYQEDQDDYLNCPMDRTLYEKFVSAIIKAEKTPVHHFEEMKCFEGCLPVEVLAERGLETLAFGPMKPVGLIDPKTGKRSYAVVQLRRENFPTTMYNLVGFQSRMKWGEQKKVFQMIPGLENAEFVRFGSMHRNTYLESPKHLSPNLSLKTDPNVFFAGQITGVEGYVESSAMGLWSGITSVARLRGVDVPPPPNTTAMGALIHTITTRPLHGVFSPMNINFGLFPPLETNEKQKEVRRKKMLDRARRDFDEWRKHLSQILKEPLFGQNRKTPQEMTEYEQKIIAG